MNKHDAIIKFSATVKNTLDTMKSTVPLKGTDIIKNCNTSIFLARKCIRDSLNILDYHRRHSDVRELVEESYRVINDVNNIYLMPYGNHYIEWFTHQLKLEQEKNPDFFSDLLCIQKMEKKYPFYNDMVDTFIEVQEIYKKFSDRLQKNLNVLEPSKFEISKEKKEEGVAPKLSFKEKLANGCEQVPVIAGNCISSIKETAEKVPSTLRKSNTKYIAIKLGVVQGGMSRTTSKESVCASI